MPPVRPAAASRAKASSREILAPGGKENARPSTNVSKKVPASGHRDEIRRRLSLSSNDERKKENGSVKTAHVISESFPVKKTPFHVHCDEKNVENSEPPERSKTASVLDVKESANLTNKEDRKQVIRGLDALSSTRKSLTDTVSKEGRRLLPPSRIPRRFRSASASTESTNSQGSARRSVSVDSKMVSSQKRWCKGAALKFGWCNGRTIEKPIQLFGEQARGSTTKINSSTVRLNRVPPTTKVVEAKRPKVPTRTETKALSEEASRTLTNGCNGPMETGRTTKREVSGIIHQLNRNLTVINKTDRSGPRAIDRIKNRLLQAEQVRVSDGKSRTESIETPVDGAGPPTVLLKGVVRPNKKDLESQEIQERDPSKDYDNFAYELLYHAEYHDDLPIVEYEREELSPRLSDDYLKKHLNGEQRRLVVMFMIRIGTHCRYPSYIVYQAVKLFDAAMDRIHVETPYIQIIALVSLWIALKAHQNFHKIPSAQTMISLAGELYKNRQDLLIKYERKILMALNFNITFADTFSLFTHYLISCKRCITFSEDAIAFIYHSGGYLIDLTLLDEHFCRTSANLIALAAAELILGLVMDTVTINARPKWLFWRGLLFGTSPQVSSKFPGEDIDRSRVQMLNRVISSASRQTGFEVVYKKYSRSRYGKISAFLLERASRLSYLETLIP